jgi:Bax protein
MLRAARYNSRLFVVVLLFTMGAYAGSVAGPVADGESEGTNFEFESYQSVVELFVELNYTPEAWAAGIREIPRVYLTHIPERWRDKTSNEIATLNKKRLFFRAMAPLVLRANELILLDRNRVAASRKQLVQSGKVSDEDSGWLQQLARRYGVIAAEDTVVTSGDLEELWTRVDIIPVSLALSQAAEESGWGTSRFAAQGNALFGQWTWGENAMKPAQQRKELGNYGLEAFESPQESVLGYMRNLNSHSAYQELRVRRAAIRESGERLTGHELAKALTRYSERGLGYVESLHAIMRVNHLGPADSAYLSADPPIHMVPVGEGSGPKID